MPSDHRIDECRVELAFRSRAGARAGEAVWQAFAKTRMLEVVEQVFDACSVPGEIAAFDTLSIDLGAAGARMNAAELERRLRAGLLAAMQGGAEPQKKRTAESAGGRGIATPLERLQQFLSFGRLPLHDAGDASAGIDQLIARVLRDDPQSFARWLRSPALDPLVLVRLAEQVSLDALEQTVGVLAPRHARSLALLAAHFEAVFDDAAPFAVGRTRVRRIVWGALVAALVARGGASLDRRIVMGDALDRAIRVLRERHGMDALGAREAARRVRAIAVLPEDAPRTHPAFPQRGPTPASLGSDPDADATEHDASPPDALPAAFAAILERAIELGRIDEVRPAWPLLLQRYAVFVVATVRRYGTLARTRRRIAEGFTDPMLQDIVRLLEPAGSEFIGEIVHRPELFRTEQPAHDPQPPVLRARLWEFTLAYLLVERGGVFNKQAYIGSVVRQMASRENLAYDALLTAITGVLEEVTVRSALHEHMLDVLHGLAREEALARRDEPDAPASGEPYTVVADDYETVLSRLRRGRYVATIRADGAVLSSVERLAARPNELARLVTELRATQRAPLRLAERLPAAAVRRLIAALLARGRAPGEGGIDDFAEALDDYAARAVDARRYLTHVLECVLRGTPVDLEAILLRSARVARRMDKAAWETVARVEPHVDGVLRVALERWIDGDAPGPQPAVWQALVRTRAEVLRSVIRDRGRAESARKMLVSQSTVPMLCDVVEVLAPGQSAFVRHVVQLPQRVPGRAAAPVAGEEARERGLWEFTLTYLLADRGSRFNRQAYMDSVVRRLAAHHNLAAEALAESLIVTLESVAVPTPLQTEMLVLLRTMSGQTHAPGREGKGSCRRKGGRNRRGDAARDVVSASSAGPEAGLREIERTLAARGVVSIRDRRRLIEAFERRLTAAPHELRQWLAHLLEEPRAIARWAAVLPANVLVRALALLRPAEYAKALACADAIAGAVIAAALRGSQAHVVARLAQRAASEARRAAPPGAPRVAKWAWEFVFRYLVVEGRAFERSRFVREFVQHLKKKWPAIVDAKLQQHIVRTLERGGTAWDRDIARIVAEALQASARPAAKPAAAKERTASPEAERLRMLWRQDNGAKQPAIRITNAGQVLAGPYLPRLFDMLLLTANGRFKSDSAAERAVHVLQFMVTGATESPEHLLTLNKILCGIPLDAPVARDVGLTDGEKSAVEGLLKGMIANWTALGTTSIAGLRESFLQREAKLRRKDDSWHLCVERRPFDMLLDRIPWGYSTIRAPWMQGVVHVEWR